MAFRDPKALKRYQKAWQSENRKRLNAARRERYLKNRKPSTRRWDSRRSVDWERPAGVASAIGMTASLPKIDRNQLGWWKEYYQRNKERVNAKNKAWLEKNKEKILPKLRAKWRRNQVKNRNRKRAQKAALRKLNPERVRGWNRKSQKKCWPKRQAYARAYYQKNKDRLKRRAKELYRANKPRFWAHVQKRRALKLKSAVNLKAIQEFIRRTKAKPMASCYYCSAMVSTSSIHFDHIIPLSKGGPHSVENLCVSCATCNLTKKAQSIQAWVKMGQQILAL